MITLLLENGKSAFRSIWQNKIQSILAILGVVIGVSAVTTLVGLGQGLKNDVSGLIQGFGSNIIFVVSGKIDTSTGSGTQSNPANFLTGDILTLDDVKSAASTRSVKAVTPISLVSGTLKFDSKQTAPTIFGTYPNALEILSVLHVDQGSMFTNENAGNTIVLSHKATIDLFADVSPIGKTVTLGTTDLEVVGVLGKAKSTSIFGSELDAVSFVPFGTAKALNKDQVKIYRIAVKTDDNASVTGVRDIIKTTILQNHHDQEDFSVLTQDDLLGLFNTFLNLATTLVSAIAAISLIVGGIGIMNIMLVTVTERTREIGLRKAVGATKRAILVQFLTESLVITFFGALLGLGLSFIATAVVSARTELRPEISLQVIGLAVGISVIIGVVFGLWPALRAARKDPIEALRYE